MTEREWTLQALTERDMTEQLSIWYSPRVVRGAFAAAGDITRYKSAADYREAVAGIAAERASHGRMILPARFGTDHAQLDDMLEAASEARPVPRIPPRARSDRHKARRVR
jgi:hypothetical protein